MVLLLPRFVVSWLLILPLSPTAAAEEFTARVISVIDGDDLIVRHNGLNEDVRLYGIDCPEEGQAYGRRAKEFTTKLAYHKTVTVQAHGSDAFGRTIADVILPDGRLLNHQLVKAGLAWWFRRYAPDNEELATLENEARASKKELWRDADPIPPWVFRKLRRGQPLDPSDFALLDRRPPSLGSSAERSPPTDQPNTLTLPIIGNRHSHIYHRPDCPNYSQVAAKNRVKFNSAAEAEAAGYRVAKNCPRS
ncbi:thermonuclease family protein [Nitrospira moscoviensis]|uniref:Putative Micrococcal nuclease-like nuclease n=1 Tax=Nitrospira moscoviensis TaxID=42253 RepID=A0A0K2GCN5_NITMO|nr:thermonuclease family protein [Nitrospira moscoviensis]ALA58357.1 putative Micrococcal nuclease-like nuclease [Nitrospira moscoviensis]